MKSRDVVQMFTNTLIIGGLVGLITSFFVKTSDFTNVLSPFDFKELLGVIIFFIGLGLVFSVVSQTGFFAYLFIHRFGLSLFRSFWTPVQILIIAFVVFDLVYFPYKATDGEVSIWWFILMSLSILGYGLLVARFKAKETNQRAFVPALFLMVVMTSVEWVPGLNTAGTDYAWLMITPLLACNTYQLMALHRLAKKNPTLEQNEKTQEKTGKQSTGNNNKR
ncbi:KinB-signaling pathway activation protein [Virgibacillus sp. W0181]|uniref:KinB-signaling pathway activation protein n=1 Tax=Virgibacillus sp. W0181 TaxID=3391581 RepID=UPI003F45B5A2